MLARQGFSSIEPELMSELDRDESPVADIKVCAGICPLGHECSMGCFDPQTCSRW